MTWQPIETAPKDGTQVILFLPQYPHHAWLGYFIDAEDFKYGKSVRRRQEWVAVGPMISLPNPQPTHWMEMPNPPENIE